MFNGASESDLYWRYKIAETLAGRDQGPGLYLL